MAAIVHGTYRTETVAGFVADFCPVCRDVRAFQVVRVGDASHVAFVSLGDGRLAGHIIRCTLCGTGRAFHEGRYSMVAEKISGTDVLIAMTHPNVHTEFAERLALESRLRLDPSALTAQQREAMLLEPFQELDPEIEQIHKGTISQKQASMWALLAASAIMGGGGGLVRFHQDKIGWVIGASIAAFIAVWVAVMVCAESRGMKRRIIPGLVRSLAPLRPTRAELQLILTRCRDSGLCSGKKIKLDLLWHALQARSA